MSIEELEELKKMVLNSTSKEKDCELSVKVDNFISWYTGNVLEDEEIIKSYYPIELRNFIEKMAVWYELRYPDCEINKLIPEWPKENPDINKLMFNENPYIEKLTSNYINRVPNLNWGEFYNFQAFYNSLSNTDQAILKDDRLGHKYRNQLFGYVKLPFISSSAHIHISCDGYIEDSDPIFVSKSNTKRVVRMDINGLHVTEFYELLKSNSVLIPKYSELEYATKYHGTKKYYREELLNCVMYRLIDRGCHYGARRALLFAKEFNCNIDIPMMYGVVISSPGLENLVREYLELGGNENLMCYVDYILRNSKMEKPNICSLSDVINRYCPNLREEQKKKMI